MLAAPPPFPPSVLEGFVDSVAALPAEVTRLMSTMRDLDGKASALAGELDAMVAEIQAMPQGAKASKEQAEALKERRASFEKKQKDCVQLAIEKAEIAQRCLDLIDENALRLDAELQRHDHGLAEYRKRTGLSPDFPGGSGAPLDADLELVPVRDFKRLAPDRAGIGVDIDGCHATSLALDRTVTQARPDEMVYRGSFRMP